MKICLVAITGWRHHTKHCREAKIKDIPAGGLGTEISGLFADVGLYSNIPELREHEIEPASFEGSGL